MGKYLVSLNVLIKGVKMEDCLGNELKIGDKIVASDMKYADLLIGEVTRFTPKKIEISFVRSMFQDSTPSKQLKWPYQICRIEKGN